MESWTALRGVGTIAAMRGSARAVPRQLVLLAAGVLAFGAGFAPAAQARPVRDPSAAPVTAAAPGDAQIRLTLRASGLSKPVFLTYPRDGSGRLFIVEQTGRIRIYQNGAILGTPFLSLATAISTGGEQGLLGLAFHPSYATNRRLYVNYTDVNGDTIIREYRASSTNPNAVASGSGRTILKIGQPYANHNGGMIVFGPDGYLYIGMGDGGDGGDPGNRAQNVDQLLGKMLRINVNGSTATRNYTNPASNPYVGIGGRDEIWQIGLRNPWRFSFDRANGNLWIADVGQGEWEEIDRAVKTSSGAGRKINWGWRVMEGRHCYSPPTGCNTSGKTLPVVEYGHASGRCAVTGGYVYRGKTIPALVGGYLFADYCTGEIWVVDATAAAPAAKTLLLDSPYLISGFGEGGNAELYVLDHGGALYAITPQ